MIRLFYLILLVACIHFNDAKLQTKNEEVNLNPFNFADFFSESEFDIPHIASDVDNLSELDKLECLIELRAIKKGLENYEQWAMRLIDAWGKLPSSILTGNLFDFGGFSECFHIERKNELYKTQYCMGHLIVDLKGIFPKSKSYGLTNSFIPNLNQVQYNDNSNGSSISPRLLIPTPKTGPAITFGLCLPTTCSLKFLEPMINDLIHEKVKNISIELDESTCQFEESASELRTLDKVAIVLLLIVLCFILVSTIYDVVCTINNSDKSQAMLAFSLFTNGMKLLSYKKPKLSEDMMTCVNGIRAISTGWVVLGHTYLMYIAIPVVNKSYYPTFASNYGNMIILAAPIAVDTFFVLSGLFVSISMLKYLEKSKGKLNVPLLYFHRYLRLTPLLAVSMLLSMTLLRFAVDGPLYPNIIQLLGEKCEKHWWPTLLYVQNYVNGDDLCFIHSWYLSVDFQLFLISPLVVYSIYMFKAKIIPVWILFVLGCVGCTIAVHLKYDYHDLLTGKDYMEIAYVPTHLRYSPWLLGVIAGFIFYEVRKSTIRIPRVINLLAWALSLGLMATVILTYYPFPQPDSKSTSLEFALYQALSRIAWSIALCWIIFACVRGYGGLINSFLSHPLWQPLSRLSYSIYLLHLPVIILTTCTLKTPIYFSELNAFHTFIGNYTITVALAVVATLAFESPIIIIEKLIFGPKKKPEKRNEENIQNVKTEEVETIDHNLKPKN